MLDQEPSLSALQAAAKLNIHRVTLYRWIRDGYCHARRVGPRKLRITEAEVARLLSEPAQPASNRQRG